MAQRILLINPWIYDFAAYDLWAKPWGLLKISSILKRSGKDVYFLDALDRHHPLAENRFPDKPDGTGKYPSEEIPKPCALKHVPRRYKRYGLGVEAFKRSLPAEEMDAVLISSGMTYWYPGAFEAIRIVRERYPDACVILGGTYATLCPDHAKKNSGADHVIPNSRIGELARLLGTDAEISFGTVLDEGIDYGWYDDPPYAVLRLSLGCPFDCAYCAQKKLGPQLTTKDPGRAFSELEGLYDKGIRRFAFYDDALLAPEVDLKAYLGSVIREGIEASFYTPNGLHARFIDGEIASLMERSGFEGPVLSLEFSSDSSGLKWHSKVSRAELEKAARELKKAGYGPGEFTVYLMLGVPGSPLHEVEEGIEFVHSLGGRVSLSEFSPVPGTRLAHEAGACPDEPLLHNNSIYPFAACNWEDIMRVKLKASSLNASLSS